MLACAIALSQQLSGINAMANYSAPIFAHALPPQLVNKNKDVKNYMVVLMFTLSTLFTVLAMWFVDRIGRKVCLLTGEKTSWRLQFNTTLVSQPGEIFKNLLGIP